MKRVILQKLDHLDFRTNEAYRTLRTNIRFSGNNIKVIAFTSTLPQEGKSRISFQLAKSFAEDGKRVLYLDADIRKTTFLQRYDVNQEMVGLSHYLTGQSTLADVIYLTNFEKLYVLFAGQHAPNPTELLDNNRFSEMLINLRKIYDYIIVDCPPLGSVIDAAVIAKICDGSVVVVESHRVRYHLAKKMINQLERSGTKVLGCVFNKVDKSAKNKKRNWYYDNEYYYE